MTVSLAEIYEQFLDESETLHQLRPHTLRAYRYELAAAAQDDRFEGSLQALTLSDLESWIARGQASPSTIGRRASAFNRFFNWAIRHGYCEGNPLLGRTPTRLRRRLPRPIQGQADQKAIDEAIAAALLPYRLIFTILRETGMRVGEVIDLRRADVELQAGRESLRVREAKNGAERIVVLGPTATPKSLRGLKPYLNQVPKGDHEILFRSTRGTRISYDSVHYQWAKVCERAGLLDEAGRPKYTIHQLRHTRGSELVAQQQPIEIVQRVLGHRDIRSTLGYAEINEAQVRAALEQPK
jgi:integrase/recombinase XerD